MVLQCMVSVTAATEALLTWKSKLIVQTVNPFWSYFMSQTKGSSFFFQKIYVKLNNSFSWI